MFYIVTVNNKYTDIEIGVFFYNNNMNFISVNIQFHCLYDTKCVAFCCKLFEKKACNFKTRVAFKCRQKL